MRDAALASMLVAIGALAPAAGGCGGGDAGPPPQEDVDAAQASAEAALAAVERARAALEILGILPVYDCGEPRATFVGAVVADLQAEVACATVTTGATATADTVTATFAAGCTVAGRSIEGDVVFTYSGGEDRLDLDADFWGLTVEGQPIQVRAGYGVCGDQETYWVDAEGTVPDPAVTFVVDGSLGNRPGLPILGGATILLDGTGSVTHAAGTDAIAFAALEYELGEPLPASGSITIETSNGHTVVVEFRDTSPVTSEVSITIDDYETVSVPILVSPL